MPHARSVSLCVNEQHALLHVPAHRKFHTCPFAIVQAHRHTRPAQFCAEAQATTGPPSPFASSAASPTALQANTATSSPQAEREQRTPSSASAPLQPQDSTSQPAHLQPHSTRRAASLRPTSSGLTRAHSYFSRAVAVGHAPPPGFLAGAGALSRTASLRSASTFAGTTGGAPRGRMTVHFDDEDAHTARLEAATKPLGALEDMERFAARLAHSFPQNAAGQVRSCIFAIIVLPGTECPGARAAL